MTREEASIIIGNIPINGDGCYSIPEYQQAKAMAIKALEQTPKTWGLDDAREDFMNDVYNTLDFLPTNNEANRIIDSFDRVTSGLEQQPCEDWYDVPSNEMTLEQARQAVKDLRKKLAEYLEQQPCDDCISRQAVIEITAETGALETQSRVRELQPVTPKEKKGKWIEKWDSDHLVILAYECSKCGMMMNVNISHYCPNCGARMVSK